MSESKERWYSEPPSDDYRLLDERILKVLVRSYNHRLNEVTKKFLENEIIHDKKLEFKGVDETYVDIIGLTPRINLSWYS